MQPATSVLRSIILALTTFSLLGACREKAVPPSISPPLLDSTIHRPLKDTSAANSATEDEYAPDGFFESSDEGIHFANGTVSRCTLEDGKWVIDRPIGTFKIQGARLLLHIETPAKGVYADMEWRNREGTRLTDPKGKTWTRWNPEWSQK